jgi:hypothetical protein
MVGESQLPGGLITHSCAKYYSLSGCVVNPRSRPGIKDMQRRKKNVEMYLCMYVGMQADSIFIVAKSKHFKHKRWEALLKRESIEDDFL